MRNGEGRDEDRGQAGEDRVAGERVSAGESRGESVAGEREMTVIEYTGGENPTAIQWLDKLPKLDAHASKETHWQWLEALCSIREAFPDRTRQSIPLGGDQRNDVIVSWPKGFNSSDIAFVIEVLSLMQQQWERAEKDK